MNYIKAPLFRLKARQQLERPESTALVLMRSFRHAEFHRSYVCVCGLNSGSFYHVIVNCDFTKEWALAAGRILFGPLTIAGFSTKTKRRLTYASMLSLGITLTTLSALKAEVRIKALLAKALHRDLKSMRLRLLYKRNLQSIQIPARRLTTLPSGQYADLHYNLTNKNNSQRRNANRYNTNVGESKPEGRRSDLLPKGLTDERFRNKSQRVTGNGLATVTSIAPQDYKEDIAQIRQKQFWREDVKSLRPHPTPFSTKFLR